MAGMRRFIGKLARAGIKGELWIDGSFLTEKIDPEDVDFALRMTHDFVSSCSKSQFGVIEWITDLSQKNLIKSEYSCDSYAFVEFSASHVLFAAGQKRREYWEDLFGHGRNGDPKGIAVLPLNCG